MKLWEYIKRIDFVKILLALIFIPLYTFVASVGFILIVALVYGGIKETLKLL